MVVVGGAVGYLLGLPLFGQAGPDSAALSGQLFGLLVPFGSAVAAVYFWIRLRERRSFRTVGFQTSPKNALVGACVGFAMFVLVVLITVTTGQMRFEVWGNGHLVNSALIGGVLLAFVGFAVQGSAEEILCRGFVLQALYRKWGLLAAVIVQSLLFVAMHLTNPSGVKPLAVLNLFLFGLFTAAWALYEGGLWGVCAMHAVWNWTQGNVFGVLVSGTEVRTSLLHTRPAEGSNDLLTGGGFGLEASLVTSAVLIVGTAVVIMLRQRRTVE
ncbi:CPBP family intramembrane metalloprotease [Allokutzneria sp. A3M-2-11 16]|uniref:CPBP family intramembrane glutamic endopeptidase n=1 Tax=Allokutzneria sp. A3M-2-11 16 TaxID=2962043 RepID=UPI0020B8F248|nr:type II CAAX endopeptidase family protein [Allokutzneria sp. A3M-2-11 16]MCP3803244.1 CPBP family intramembrane metalloprotease [Allokutzneria sp. A3M-2-11 16]